MKKAPKSRGKSKRKRASKRFSKHWLDAVRLVDLQILADSGEGCIGDDCDRCDDDPCYDNTNCGEQDDCGRCPDDESYGDGCGGWGPQDECDRYEWDPCYDNDCCGEQDDCGLCPDDYCYGHDTICGDMDDCWRCSDDPCYENDDCGPCDCIGRCPDDPSYTDGCTETCDDEDGPGDGECGYIPNVICCVCDSGPSEYDLESLNFQVQQQTQWCWIASAVNVDIYYNGGVTIWTQCTLYNAICSTYYPLYLPYYGITTCCGSSSIYCNQPGVANYSLTMVGHFAGTTFSNVDFQTIVDQIDANQPVMIEINWWGGGGNHFLLIMGYECDSDGTPYIYYSNTLDAIPENVRQVSICDLESTLMADWTTTYFTQS